MIEARTRNKTWAKAASQLCQDQGTEKKEHEIIVFEMIDGEAIEIYGGNNLADYGVLHNSSLRVTLK